MRAQLNSFVIIITLLESSNANMLQAVHSQYGHWNSVCTPEHIPIRCDMALVTFDSIILFCLNILLFATFILLSTIRYVLCPELWWVMLRHPDQGLFLSADPMSLGAIVNMTILVCVTA